MSDTPIFDEITEKLPEDHAIHWLDPAAVLTVGTETDDDADDEDPLPLAA